ncbi:MAG: sugar phosphate isomerase/epimerase [Fimbriimonadaceae bacterium]|nr:sugar phosphate isomerase/epimerase [Fimbriimonadaceae bacterium]
MKLAVQLGLLPGATVADKQQWAADHGVEGIEISAWNYKPEELGRAKDDFASSPVPISSVCGNSSFDFLDPDPAKRRASMDACKAYLRFCGEVGAAGQIVPPIFGGPRINDLSPYLDAITLEKNLLVELVKELGDVAAAAGCWLLLEPLNRYEQHLLRRQADGVEICERAQHAHVMILADFFHMHIEETNTPDAIRAAGRWIRHFHLADNTRQEPGTGDIDYVAGMKACLDIGFGGYLAYECGVSGDDKAVSLAKSLDYMRDCIARARAL